MRGGQVQHVRDLLARYKSLKAPQGVVIDIFLKAVQEVCHIEVQKKAITYKVASRTIGLAFAGPRKSEIMLNSRKILSFCKAELGEKSAPIAIV